jgi:hypothetical protein
MGSEATVFLWIFSSSAAEGGVRKSILRVLTHHAIKMIRMQLGMAM